MGKDPRCKKGVGAGTTNLSVYTSLDSSNKSSIIIQQMSVNFYFLRLQYIPWIGMFSRKGSLPLFRTFRRRHVLPIVLDQKVAQENATVLITLRNRSRNKHTTMKDTGRERLRMYGTPCDEGPKMSEETPLLVPGTDLPRKTWTQTCIHGIMLRKNTKQQNRNRNPNQIRFHEIKPSLFWF